MLSLWVSAPPCSPLGWCICAEASCVLGSRKTGGEGSDSHRDCGYIQYPQEDWQLWPHDETNSPFSLICHASGLRGFVAPLHPYPNSGPLQVHGPTQHIHISSWRIVGNSETHRPVPSMDVVHTQGHLSNSGTILWPPSVGLSKEWNHARSSLAPCSLTPLNLWSFLTHLQICSCCSVPSLLVDQNFSFALEFHT